MNKDKLIKYGAIIAAAVIVLIMMLLFFNRDTYKTPIKGSIELLNEKSINEEDYVQYYTFDSYYKYMRVEEEIFNTDKTEFKDYIEDLEIEYGSNYKISYDIKSSKKVDSDMLDEIISAMDATSKQVKEEGNSKLNEKKKTWENEGLTDKEIKKLNKAYEKYLEKCSELKVKEAYEVDIECEIKGRLGSDTFEIKNIVVAKVDGQWMLYSGYITPGVVHYLTVGMK